MPSSSKAPAIVWAVGDGGDGSENARAVVARIAAGRVDRVLYLGDVYTYGTALEFRKNYATTYGRFASLTAPTPGDNEWPHRAEGYNRYWARVHSNATTPPYFSFRIGGWKILSLNSEIARGAGSPQHRWLVSELRRPGTCRLAFWHRPRYSAGVEHGDQPDVAPLWNALRGRAKLVLNAHDHDMQQFAPIDGITEIVSGAGGHRRYRLNRSDQRLVFGNDTSYGVLRLELMPGKARFAFVDVDGRTLHSGSVRCRP